MATVSNYVKLSTMMGQVTIPFPSTDDEWRRLYVAGEFAIEIKRWLGEQGLIMGTDFEWAIDSDAQQITFSFTDDANSWASLLLLKFSHK